MKQPLDLADSNIAGLGTDLEKKVRLDASQKEPAWDGIGSQVGLKVFRIEQFKVVPWPVKDYGRFYSGDSYIVINTYKKSASEPKLYHDIHFWLGLKTSQDEAGTAAYKTVELDDYLGTIPTQHREVQGFESPLFLSYFRQFNVVEGGVDSGFNKVETQNYVPRLFQVRISKAMTNNTLVIREVPISYKSLNSGDVFIADTGVGIFQWNGAKSSPMERHQAAEYCQKLESERMGKAKATVFAESDNDAEPFWTAIGGKGPVLSAEDATTNQKSAASSEKVLYRLTGDKTQSLSFKEESKGTIRRSQLDSNDVFIIDVGMQVFVWIGKGSSQDERRSSLKFAIKYLTLHHPSNLNAVITRVFEGHEGECASFSAAIAA